MNGILRNQKSFSAPSEKNLPYKQAFMFSEYQIYITLLFLKKPFVRPFEDDYDATTNQAKNSPKKPNNNQHVIKEESSKGQIISEENFGVFNS